jgi:Co/Zn/Cd efflux system component
VGLLDAVLGIIVGAILVGKWSLGLIQETGKTLLDEKWIPVVDEVREVIESLHVRCENYRYSCLESWEN